MKKFQYIPALVAAAAMILAASCNKDKPAPVPEGVTDAEYIDGVLSDAMAMVNPADLEPFMDFFEGIFMPLSTMNPTQEQEAPFKKLQEDLYADFAAEDVLSIDLRRFAGTYTIDDKSINYTAPASEGASELKIVTEYEEGAELTLSWGAGTFEFSGTVDRNKAAWQKQYVGVPEDKRPSMPAMEKSPKKMTFIAPTSFSVKLVYNEKQIGSGAVDIHSASINIVEDGGANVTGDISLNINGIQIQAPGAVLNASQQARSISAPITLSSKKGFIGQFTADYTEASTSANVSVSGQLLNRLAFTLQEDPVAMGSAKTAEEANAAFSCDFFYTGAVRSHKARNGSLVYVPVEGEDRNEIVPAFASQNFVPQEPGFVSPENFPNTYARGAAIFSWVMLRVQTAMGGKGL